MKMNRQKIKNNLPGIALICIGILSIILAISCLNKTYGFDILGWVKHETYGGDAYTGIQNATATTANYIHALHSDAQILATILQTGFGDILLIGGFVITLYGIHQILKNKTTEPKLEEKSFGSPECDKLNNEPNNVYSKKP